MLYECVQNVELWKLPPRASHIRLAFTWKLVEQGETIPTKADTCVVHLHHAERRGVPVPADFAEVVAARIGAGNEHQGSLPTRVAQLHPLAVGKSVTLSC